MTFQEHIGFICIRASPAYKQKVRCKLHTHYRVVGREHGEPTTYLQANVMVKPPREFDIFLKESAFGTYLMWKSMKNCIEVINWPLAHSFAVSKYGAYKWN